MEADNNVVQLMTKLEINDRNKIITVRINDEAISCDREILQNECEYFKALNRFEENSCEIEIKGGISYVILKIILDFLSEGHLKIDLSNFQEILQGCQFLQCNKCEEATISFISQHLSKENVFNVYQFGNQILCQKLINTCKFYIENVFHQILCFDGANGHVENFLEWQFSVISRLSLSQVQFSEELLFFAIIAWLQHNLEERKHHSENLLQNINLKLFTQASLQYLEEDKELLEEFEIVEKVAEAVKYKNLRLDEKIKHWEDVSRGPRWPTMVVTGSSGSNHASIHCCSISKLDPFPVWKNLTKKPGELKKASTGSCMVYCHPRLYFLGGEKNWYLHWFDLELNRWGVEGGVPPTRLLSGGCVLNNNLYLVGGVTLDQWEGVAGGAGSVSTSSAMDRYG